MIRVIEGIGIVLAMVGAACLDSPDMVPWAIMMLVGLAMFAGGNWIEENYHIG